MAAWCFHEKLYIWIKKYGLPYIAWEGRSLMINESRSAPGCPATRRCEAQELTLVAAISRLCHRINGNNFTGFRVPSLLSAVCSLQHCSTAAPATLGKTPIKWICMTFIAVRKLVGYQKIFCLVRWWSPRPPAHTKATVPWPQTHVLNALQYQM